MGAKRKHDKPNEGNGEWPVSPCKLKDLCFSCMSLLFPPVPSVTLFLAFQRHGTTCQATLLAVQGRRGQSRPLSLLQHQLPGHPVVAKPSPAELAQEGEALGQGGAMHYRAVYHLADSPGVPMLDLKDILKVCLQPL